MQSMDKPAVFVLATRNSGKTEEIRALLKGYPVELKNLDDFGPIPEVIEDGETFDDNAYKKASFTARVLGLPAIADDSGLVVEALNGEPGVYSARYAGEDADDAANNAKLLEQMAGVEDRRAAFQCVISIAVPTGAALTYEGRCDGVIAQTPSGEGGFGYDPLFYCPDKEKTFAELNLEEKGEISHRGRALKEVAKEFDKILTWLEIHMPVQERFECKGGCS
ncbi:non-canonical purine NTP pyrophosphatase [Desulfoluna limicola]|uniref:dITP/XTP pyrophosphatase n=2 Tax=Desulfoluna limicola TaxID=2810562 RepID=A0ABM7PML7_9BACT|nr:XTP/dITP diphosphatase [Desulfoluna limicola]BCS98775.1 non-canonical purine NTP pyrophosphatase [Desulfoluna limicola]